MNLNLPLDFERLPEFWQLCDALRARRNVKMSQPAEGDPAGDEQMRVREAEVGATAIVLWLRLWVVLGYLARHTSRPGWLNAAGERQFCGAFTQFGEDCPPTLILEGNLLRKAEDGWYCDLFTQFNAHLSGDHISNQKLGNVISRLNAARTNIAATALQQGQLLSPELFQRRDGSPMAQRSIDRSMVLILTLDRCLKSPQRHPGSYSAGLMADACAVVEARSQEELQEFYYWLAARRDHPMMPKTAEEVLKDWDRFYKSSKL